ncbi:MAG: hypothetical protein ACR2OU_20575 [Thermomicrobiales bacterium]
MLMAIVGLGARLLVAPFLGHKYDVRAYLSWTEYLQHNPLSTFYGANLGTPPDHMPGDLMIFAAIGRIAPATFPGFSFESWYAELIIRLVPILSDVLIGVLIYFFVRRRVDVHTALVAASLAIFNPGLFTVSAIWGQWDSFAAVILLGIIMLALRGHSLIIWPLLMYLVLIKPQYAIFGLLILVHLVRLAFSGEPVYDERARKSPLRLARDIAAGFPLSLLVFIGINFPFSVGFPGQANMKWSIQDRVRFAIDRYDDVTLGALNIWTLFGKSLGDPDGAMLIGNISYATAGRILLVVALLGAIVVTSLIAPADWALLCGCFIAAMSIYSFPTRVHERYMMPAIVMLLMMWPLAQRLLPIVIGLSLTYTASLILAMWWDIPIHFTTLSLALAFAQLSLFAGAITVMLLASGMGWMFHRNLNTAIET